MKKRWYVYEKKGYFYNGGLFELKSFRFHWLAVLYAKFKCWGSYSRFLIFDSQIPHEFYLSNNVFNKRKTII